MSDDDWRKSAYLTKENWPDAIPWTGPKREYGPYPWGVVENEHDRYPWSHPAAGSVGHKYMGDVCGWCGVPLRYDEIVRDRDGQRGELLDLSPSDEPRPTYHPECWQEREAEKQQDANKTLGDFA